MSPVTSLSFRSSNVTPFINIRTRRLLSMLARLQTFSVAGAHIYSRRPVLWVMTPQVARAFCVFTPHWDLTWASYLCHRIRNVRGMPCTCPSLTVFRIMCVRVYLFVPVRLKILLSLRTAIILTVHHRVLQVRTVCNLVLTQRVAHGRCLSTFIGRIDE